MRVFLTILIFLFAFYAAVSPAQAQETSVAENNVSNSGYKLGAGDKIKLTVFGEEDLSGQFDIDGSGYVSLPFIGNIKAAGLDSRGLEKAVVDALKGDYLVNPRVSVDVLNFRPFFILGEVNKPGSYPYVNGLTVLNAVALAGGYTQRAKTSEVLITREKNGEKVEEKGQDDTPVYAGDTVRVLERFF